MMEFHVSRKARDRYEFDQSLFSLRGNVIFANFHAVRQFAQKINAKQDLINFPEKAIQAGQINAMGLIDEIFHFVFHLYLQENKKNIIEDLITHLEVTLGKNNLDKSISAFANQFPTVALYKKEISLQDYLNAETDETPNSQIVIEEMLMLWLTNVNPAMSPYGELFDDTELSKTTYYHRVILGITDFFKSQPHYGPDDHDIVTMLRSPAVEVPHSLSGQLEYIRRKWGYLLGSYLYRLLGSLDMIKEEQKITFAGSGTTQVPDMSMFALEDERFSPDSDWMPKVVMLAKNTNVWLDQLSKQSNRRISSLDQVPDAELDKLAQWGFTGLWLIGLWERSQSSKRLKQLCGKPDAVASAYSLSRYEIANDLGGEKAYQNLKERAAQRGIRLASDMVPNHVGIDSDWVYEHPDWFISLDYSPFPAYSFNGPDLSHNPQVSINLEDHYYDRSDAAVVFKRYDHSTGQAKYIYHGNDGTNMPWNDTAQLNYLLPEVREAVIQTILHVARKFPIIRFDAAMTLTKKHFQRLWFPQPGTGGAIPTRSDYALSKKAFDQAMPEEFWREVVDRVAKEVPDTLLLAEAFWMMEGFFVRTLGMHRVYNSAFMNMLRNEENAKYRQVIKNTLQFDPQILKRYVNFMNNPDERTAVEQFGKGDKYFGICTLMVTMPGLPMFGHGQIEGFAEKYGMEYYRAYWDENPDPYLIQRHERDIFPLLHQRHLFANVKNFLLYDFYTSEGQVNENVYAYSNGAGDQRALVVFHNKFGDTRGWVKTSASFNTNISSNNAHLIQINLHRGLNLKGNPNHFVIFKDHQSNLEFIRSSQEIKERGMYFELDAYKYHVFLDFHEVADDTQHKFARLNDYLNGRGVPSIEEALYGLTLSPVLTPLRDLINPKGLSGLYQARIEDAHQDLDKQLLDITLEAYSRVIRATAEYLHISMNHEILMEETRRSLERVLYLKVYDEHFGFPGSKKYTKAIDFVQHNLDSRPYLWYVLIIWVLMRNIGGPGSDTNAVKLSRSLIDEWRLGKLVESVMVDLGFDVDKSQKAVTTIKLLTSNQNWYKKSEEKSLSELFEEWLTDDQIRSFLKINRHDDVLWFNKEAFENFLWWMMTAALISSSSDPNTSASKHVEDMLICHETIIKILAQEENSDFQVARLLEGLS